MLRQRSNPAGRSAHHWHPGNVLPSNSSTNDPNVYHVRVGYITRILRSTKSKEMRSTLSGSSVVARTEFSYDDPIDTGNLTLQQSWDSTKGTITYPLTVSNSVSVAHQYDASGFGNLTQLDAVFFRCEVDDTNIAGGHACAPQRVLARRFSGCVDGRRRGLRERNG